MARRIWAITIVCMLLFMALPGTASAQQETADSNNSAEYLRAMLSGLQARGTPEMIEKIEAAFRNNGGDDNAAGLALSEKMRNQARGLDRASNNAQDGIRMLQEAEGALQDRADILRRLSEATRGENGGTLDDTAKENIISELTKIRDSIVITPQFGVPLPDSLLEVLIDAGILWRGFVDLGGAEVLTRRWADGDGSLFIDSRHLPAGTIVYMDMDGLMYHFMLKRYADGNKIWMLDGIAIANNVTNRLKHLLPWGWGLADIPETPQ